MSSALCVYDVADARWFAIASAEVQPEDAAMRRGPVLALLLAAPVFLAARDAHAVDVWMNAGASEVVIVPDATHYAVYGYVAITVPFDTGWHGIYVIPGLGFELAPEVERGGFTGYLTAEKSVSGSVAADLIVTFVHDQSGVSSDDAVFSVGLGVGVSIVMGRAALSPSLSMYRTLDDAAGWSLAPTLNVAYPF
jgi:hypothetical protein